MTFVWICCSKALEVVKRYLQWKLSTPFRALQRKKKTAKKRKKERLNSESDYHEALIALSAFPERYRGFPSPPGGRELRSVELLQRTWQVRC